MCANASEGDVDCDEGGVVFSTVEVVGGEGLIFVGGGGDDWGGDGCFFGWCGYFDWWCWLCNWWWRLSCRVR